MRHDFDVVVVGSGFGGSVAALRLAEKGYRVLVYEAGRRFADADFAKTSWDVRNYLFAPRLGCYGVQRIHWLPDVAILAGAGVGGGSLNYANTLYEPPGAFYADPQWARLANWRAELAPHYATAKRMLGVVPNTCQGPVEDVMAAAAADLGVASTFRHTPVGVFLGEPGRRVPDPYFGGRGPERTGCIMCGNCMVGCRYDAKNTLVKNYLWFAERAGVRIEPLRTVVGVAPLDPVVPGDGYRVTTEATNARGARGRRSVSAARVVLSGGAWGTQELLHALKRTSLPGLSDALGRLTRTNSESLGGAVLRRVPSGVDLTRGLAITTSFHVDEHTHVENCRYGKGSNLMGALAAVLVDAEAGHRLLRFALEVGRHPLRAAGFGDVRRWSERAVIALVMQSLDNSITVSGRPRRFGRGVTLTSRQGHGAPNPTWFPQASAAVRAITAALHRATDVPATPAGNLTALLDMPLTAHFIGGCVISGTPSGGVVDLRHRVWGYEGLYIVDGSTVSANLGVNPALTITAQAERAISLWETARPNCARRARAR